MKIGLGKYTFFKGESWPWLQQFLVDDFLSLNLKLMKQSACWPLDWSQYLPNRLMFLSGWGQSLYFGIAVLASAHLAFLWLYSFVMKLSIATTPINDHQLIDISHCMIESIIYSFTLFGLVYYRLRHDKCAQLMAHINTNFKRRSAIGAIRLFEVFICI